MPNACCAAPRVDESEGQDQVLDQATESNFVSSFVVTISTEILCDGSNGDITEQGIIVMRVTSGSFCFLIVHQSNLTTVYYSELLVLTKF